MILMIRTGKIRFVEEAAQILSTLDNPVEVEAYIKKTASDTGISEQSVLGKYTELRSKNRRRSSIRTREAFKRREVSKINKEKPPEERVTDTVIEAEKRLLSIMSQSKRLCLKANRIMRPEEYSNEGVRHACPPYG